MRPFPGPGGRWQVSNGDATYSVWSRTRQELLYASGPPSYRIMSVSYAVQGNAFHADRPRVWMDGRYMPRGPSALGGLNRSFDLAADGQRVALMKMPVGPSDPREATHDSVIFIFNFLDELRRVAPVKP